MAYGFNDNKTKANVYTQDQQNAQIDAIYSAISDVERIANNKAPISSPSFTGMPKGPTPATSMNSPQLATTAFVRNVLKELMVTRDITVSSNLGSTTVYESVTNPTGYEALSWKVAGNQNMVTDCTMYDNGTSTTLKCTLGAAGTYNIRIYFIKKDFIYG